MQYKDKNLMYSTVLAFREMGLTIREVSKKVAIPISTVGFILKKYEKQASFKRVVGSGRLNVFNEITIKEILHFLKMDPKISAPKLNMKVKEAIGVSISDQTIRNYLKKNDFKACTPSKKPFLSKKKILLKDSTL